jgi:hypothetical protein
MPMRFALERTSTGLALSSNVTLVKTHKDQAL